MSPTPEAERTPVPRRKTSKRHQSEALPDGGLPDRIPLPPLDGRSFARTDTGNAERLIARFGQRLRWCRAWNSWLIWDSHRWARDEKLQAEAWAKQTARSIMGEAAYEQENDELRAALARWAIASESAHSLRRMLERATSEPGVPVVPAELDSNGYLLNVIGQTIDLHTGATRKNDPRDLCTRLAPVRYDPHAACPRWEQFLLEIMGGDPDLVAYLRRCVGYSLTGDTRERCFFLLWGSGANGKSTFIETLRAVLGDYANTADFDSFCPRHSEGPRNDIADLHGSRFVSAVETDDGKRLAEGLLKRLSGKDEVKVRFLNKEHFRFRPAFKVWLAANHKPIIRGTDPAIWDRVRLIPFRMRFRGNSDDQELDKKLLTELPGILNWAIIGCREWQQGGLGSPPQVEEATNLYRQESDSIADFIAECCEVAPRMACEFGTLFSAFDAWAKANNEPSLTSRAFGLRLEEKGFLPDRDRKVRVRTGIDLKGDRPA